MKQYKLINNLMGWMVFAVAAVVYCIVPFPPRISGRVSIR